MKGYKAFRKGMICDPNGSVKQYAENTVFEEPEASLCHCGMHFCENPLDVLDFFPLIDDNGDLFEVAEVEALDTPVGDGKKFCTKKLRIGAKLTLPLFIRASIDFLFEKAKIEEGKDTDTDAAFVSKASDERWSQLAASGYGSKLAASGDGSKLAASGYGSQLAASGDGSQLAASGYGSKLAASGDGSKLAASGYGSQLAASGDGSQLAASGYGSKLAASGKRSVVAAIGPNGQAKAAEGCWITLAEWGFDSVNNWAPLCVKTCQVDGKTIKADTFYKLINGEFVEANLSKEG